MDLAAAVALVAAVVAGATPPVLSPAPAKTTWWVGYEAARDRFRYHFDNPSSFNTTYTVPHFFEQSYRADNTWLVAGGRYPLLGGFGETEVAASVERATTGDDYDTFFQPDGNVIVYGTTAEVSLRGFRFSQHLESQPRRGFSLRAGYSYQRARSIFHDSESTTTMSIPPSFSSFWNTGRETTISELHEVQVGTAWRAGGPQGWSIVARADAAPVRLARLTTILPDKYPGQDIVFMSKGLSVASRLTVGWQRHAFLVRLSAGHYGTWNYRSTDQFHRDLFAAAVHVGIGK